jgi:hypothetical protein
MMPRPRDEFGRYLPTGNYSKQPAYLRIYRRHRYARVKAELDAIRASASGKEPVRSGPSSPVHRGPWSSADEDHAVRLAELGFEPDRIAPVIQRTTEGVERRLWLLRKGRPRRWSKTFLRDARGRFSGSAEAHA